MVVCYGMTHTLIFCLEQGNIRCLGAGYGWVVKGKKPKNEDVDRCVHYPATEQRVRKANFKISVVEIRLPQPARRKLKTSASTDNENFQVLVIFSAGARMNTNKFPVIDKVTTSKIHDNNRWVVLNVSNN